MDLKTLRNKRKYSQNYCKKYNSNYQKTKGIFDVIKKSLRKAILIITCVIKEQTIVRTRTYIYYNPF